MNNFQQDLDWERGEHRLSPCDSVAGDKMQS